MKTDDRDGFLEKLKQAEAMIQEVVSEMDERKEFCSHCGVTRFVHFDEHQIAESLSGAIGRCMRARRMIEQYDEEEG